MSDGKACKASLFINEGNKWIIRKNKKNRELTSPTQQILDERRLLENVITSCPVRIQPVLVLSNTELFIKKNIKLPYDIVRLDQLEDFIYRYSDSYSENDRRFILDDIDTCRIN